MNQLNIKISTRERAILEALARISERSRSDILREFIRSLVSELPESEIKKLPNQPT